MPASVSTSTALAPPRARSVSQSQPQAPSLLLRNAAPGAPYALGSSLLSVPVRLNLRKAQIDDVDKAAKVSEDFVITLTYRHVWHGEPIGARNPAYINASGSNNASINSSADNNRENPAAVPLVTETDAAADPVNRSSTAVALRNNSVVTRNTASPSVADVALIGSLRATSPVAAAGVSGDVDLSASAPVLSILETVVAGGWVLGLDAADLRGRDGVSGVDLLPWPDAKRENEAVSLAKELVVSTATTVDGLLHSGLIQMYPQQQQQPSQQQLMYAASPRPSCANLNNFSTSDKTAIYNANTPAFADAYNGGNADNSFTNAVEMTVLGKSSSDAHVSIVNVSSSRDLNLSTAPLSPLVASHSQTLLTPLVSSQSGVAHTDTSTIAVAASPDLAAVAEATPETTLVADGAGGGETGIEAQTVHEAGTVADSKNNNDAAPTVENVEKAQKNDHTDSCSDGGDLYDVETVLDSSSEDEKSQAAAYNNKPRGSGSGARLNTNAHGQNARRGHSRSNSSTSQEKLLQLTSLAMMSPSGSAAPMPTFFVSPSHSYSSHQAQQQQRPGQQQQPGLPKQSSVVSVGSVSGFRDSVNLSSSNSNSGENNVNASSNNKYGISATLLANATAAAAAAAFKGSASGGGGTRGSVKQGGSRRSIANGNGSGSNGYGYGPNQARGSIAASSVFPSNASDEALYVDYEADETSSVAPTVKPGGHIATSNSAGTISAGGNSANAPSGVDNAFQQQYRLHYGSGANNSDVGNTVRGGLSAGESPYTVRRRGDDVNTSNSTENRGNISNATAAAMIAAAAGAKVSRQGSTHSHSHHAKGSTHNSSNYAGDSNSSVFSASGVDSSLSNSSERHNNNSNAANTSANAVNVSKSKSNSSNSSNNSIINAETGAVVLVPAVTRPSVSGIVAMLPASAYNSNHAVKFHNTSNTSDASSISDHNSHDINSSGSNAFVAQHLLRNGNKTNARASVVVIRGGKPHDRARDRGHEQEPDYEDVEADDLEEVYTEQHPCGVHFNRSQSLKTEAIPTGTYTSSSSGGGNNAHRNAADSPAGASATASASATGGAATRFGLAPVVIPSNSNTSTNSNSNSSANTNSSATSSTGTDGTPGTTTGSDNATPAFAAATGGNDHVGAISVGWVGVSPGGAEAVFSVSDVMPKRHLASSSSGGNNNAAIANLNAPLAKDGVSGGVGIPSIAKMGNVSGLGSSQYPRPYSPQPSPSPPPAVASDMLPGSTYNSIKANAASNSNINVRAGVATKVTLQAPTPIIPQQHQQPSSEANPDQPPPELQQLQLQLQQQQHMQQLQQSLEPGQAQLVPNISAVGSQHDSGAFVRDNNDGVAGTKGLSTMSLSGDVLYQSDLEHSQLQLQLQQLSQQRSAVLALAQPQPQSQVNENNSNMLHNINAVPTSSSPHDAAFNASADSGFSVADISGGDNHNAADVINVSHIPRGSVCASEALTFDLPRAPSLALTYSLPLSGATPVQRSQEDGEQQRKQE